MDSTCSVNKPKADHAERSQNTDQATSSRRGPSLRPTKTPQLRQGRRLSQAKPREVSEISLQSQRPAAEPSISSSHTITKAFLAFCCHREPGIRHRNMRRAIGSAGEPLCGYSTILNLQNQLTQARNLSGCQTGEPAMTTVRKKITSSIFLGVFTVLS